MISPFGKIPLFIYFFNMDYIAKVNVLLPLIIAVFIGTNLGKYILAFIPETLFKRMFKILLTIIAIRLIFLF